MNAWPSRTCGAGVVHGLASLKGPRTVKLRTCGTCTSLLNFDVYPEPGN